MFPALDVSGQRPCARTSRCKYATDASCPSCSNSGLESHLGYYGQVLHQDQFPQETKLLGWTETETSDCPVVLEQSLVNAVVSLQLIHFQLYIYQRNELWHLRMAFQVFIYIELAAQIHSPANFFSFGVRPNEVKPNCEVNKQSTTIFWANRSY